MLSVADAPGSTPIAPRLATNWLQFTYKIDISVFSLNVEQLQHNVPYREKTYLLTCTPDEDSNQPTHAHSLMIVFAVYIRKLCILG